MRSKTILSTAAFIIAFVSSAAFASLFIPAAAPFSDAASTLNYNNRKTSCFKNRNADNRVADKIESIINQDKINGNRRGKRVYQIDRDYRPAFSSLSFPEYVEAVSEYVNNSEDLSYDDTPGEFQAAWLEHMKAWRDYSNFLDKMKSSAERAKFSEAKLIEFDNKYSGEINDSWYEVLRIGRDYGAQVY